MSSQRSNVSGLLASRRWPLLAFALLIACGPSLAARIDPQRVIAPEKVSNLSGLQAVVSLEQPAQGVLMPHPTQGTSLGLSLHMVSQPSLAVTTFAAGAAAAGAAFLLEIAVKQGEMKRLRREAQARLLALGRLEDYRAMHAAWRDDAASLLLESGWIAGDIVIKDQPETSKRRKGGPCHQPDHCLWVTTRWGLSWDGRRVETQTVISIWSPDLRKPGTAAGRDPDFSNLLVYLSDPIELPEIMTQADRKGLRRAASDAYAFNGIPELVEQTGSSRPSVASAARSEVIPLLEAHRERLRDAKAKRWRPESRAFRSAQLWGESGAARLSAALAEAQVELEEMLRVELSAAGQSAKSAGKFKGRNRHQPARVIKPGHRQIAYLNDGTLVSMRADDTFGAVWPLHYSEAIELAAQSSHAESSAAQ